MFVVDTNVLVYAANKDCPEHGRCLELLEQWRAQTTVWYVTWGIVYEFLRIVTHPRVLPQPWQTERAWSFVEALLAAPSVALLVETDRHARVAAEIVGSDRALLGNRIHDAHIAALMKEHGIRRIYTRDTDFHRFRFLEVRDPLES